MIGRGTLAASRVVGARGTSAFRHRNYRLFFGGQAVSLVGTWMQQVAQAWLILQLTGDPIWLGIAIAAQFLPVMVLGLFAGVAADALPKRQTLIAVQVVMMALAAILAALVLTGVVEVWMILVLAVLLGCANAVDMPVRQAFAIELVGRGDISNAVALNSAMFNGARIIGPAAAGLAIGAFGIGLAFVINALSFLAVIVALALMDDDDLHGSGRVARPGSTREVFEHLTEGLRYVRSTPAVLFAVTVLGVVATAGMNFGVLIPAFTAEVLGGGATEYGFLMAASGIGSLVAALGLAFSGRTRPSRIAQGAIVLGLSQMALAATGLYPVALGLMVLSGFGAIAMAATANATIQLRVPDVLRGRVMSVYTTVFVASAPIGGLVMGGIASFAGTPVAIAIGGALSLIAGIVAAFWGRQVFAAPSTSAAFNPPNPNEVESTRS